MMRIGQQPHPPRRIEGVHAASVELFRLPAPPPAHTPPLRHLARTDGSTGRCRVESADAASPKQVATAIAWRRPRGERDIVDFIAMGPKDVAPEQLSSAFERPLPESVVMRLLSCSRIQLNLQAVLSSHHQFECCSVDDIDELDWQTVLADLADLQKISTLSGIMMNGDAIRRLIRKEDTSAVVDMIGKEAYAFVVSSTVGGQGKTHPSGTMDLSTIAADGAGCMEAWAATLPKGVKQRLAVRLPSDFFQGGKDVSDIAGNAPDLVRQAASFVLAREDSA